MTKSKICKHCNLEKPFEDFGKEKRTKTGIKARCRKCDNLYSKKYIETRREYGRKEENKIRRKEIMKSPQGKEINFKNNLKKFYNITPEQYYNTLKEQNECCAICGKHYSLFNTRLHVDHNHSTGKIRGLLCLNCNHLIGKAHESTEILNSAIQYLNLYDEDHEENRSKREYSL